MTEATKLYLPVPSSTLFFIKNNTNYLSKT